jgi:phosphatidylglycerol:prolipoprotein diacylglycerol transferase
VYPTVEIASHAVSTYALIHVVGTLIAGMLLFHLLFRAGIEGDVLRRLIVVLVLSGVAGAVGLGYLLGLWEGKTGWVGLSSAGLLMGSFAGTSVFVRLHSLNFGTILDHGAIATSLWLGIGRIGCAMAGCCYGKPTDGALGRMLPDISGSVCPRYPTQVLAAAVDLLLFSILLYLSGREDGRRSGNIAMLFIGAFAFKRMLLDFLRADLQPVLGPVSPHQLLALVVFLLVVWAFIRQRYPGMREG